MDVFSFQPVVIVQAVCVDERRAAASILGNEFLSPCCLHFVAQFSELRTCLIYRDDVFGCKCHEVLWPLGGCDFEARHFGGDTPKLQHVACHDRGADFSCRKGNEYIVHGSKTVGQSGRISI
jgi:hypothetical protein